MANAYHQLGLQLSVKCAVAGTVVLLTKVLWELLFSPLRAFPGPFLARLTNIWRSIKTARGDVDSTQLRLHRKYGSAVRIGPNCVSLSDPNLIGPVYKNGWIKVRSDRTLLKRLASSADGIVPRAICTDPMMSL